MLNWQKINQLIKLHNTHKHIYIVVLLTQLIYIKYELHKLADFIDTTLLLITADDAKSQILKLTSSFFIYL